MREVHEFPAVRPLVETWLEHCEHSRAAWRFLADNEGVIADEHSAVQLWHTEDDERRFAWCYIQQRDKLYTLTVVHLEGAAVAALVAPEVLAHAVRQDVFEAALDTLDCPDVFPLPGRRDCLRFLKEGCEAGLLELTIDALDDVPIDELAERHHLLSELLGYCNAMGA